MAPATQNQNALFKALMMDEPNETFRYVLYLPHLSPIRDPVVGDWCQSKSVAKWKAAMAAVRTLHEMGELDYRLKPKSRLEEHEDDDDEETEAGKPKAGTKKRRRYYETAPPRPFTAGRPAHLYKIALRLTEEISREAWAKKQHALYRPEEHPRKMGVIVGAEIPEAGLSAFHLHTGSGRVLVQLEYCGAVPPLTGGQMKSLAEFHDAAFGPDGLALTPPWTEAAAAVGRQNTDYAAAPVIVERGRVVVDFDCVAQVVNAKAKRPHLDHDERFSDAVVIPVAGGTEGAFFVEEVVRDRSPSSTFPNDKTMTFLDYYRKKYGIAIEDPRQPLLRISNARARPDMKNPVVVGAAGDVYPYQHGYTPNGELGFVGMDREKFLKGKTLLVPELVRVNPMPASLWRECQILPFALERVQGRAPMSSSSFHI